MSSDFWQEQVTQTKAIITAYNAAILALSTGKTQSYTLNTGQTTQAVTRKDIGRLNGDLDVLLNRLATLEARCDGSAHTVQPAW